MLKGIDVSSHQGNIDWNEINVDFAIIRCGFGDDTTTQDDSKFIENINGCIKRNIPFGIYLYSYATNLGGNGSIDSEVKHCKRLLESISQKPFCVYIDMEDKSTTKLGKTLLTDFALEFCKQITNLGYKAGVYANKNWFTNYLDYNVIKERGYSVWLAHYGIDKASLDCDIWQYSENGIVTGISDNSVDMNYMLNDIRNGSTPAPVEELKITYQTWDDVKNKWLPNVINDSDYAGTFGNDVCAIYINSNRNDVYYKVHYKNGNWLPEVKNREDYAGIYNKPIDGLMIKGVNEYRVHLRTQRRWLGWVNGYNQNDSKNGYAGILGNEIDGVQIR